MARSILDGRVTTPGIMGAAVDALLKVSGGHFIYLERIANRLPGRITSVEMIKALPKLLDGLYLRFFESQLPALEACAANTEEAAGLSAAAAAGPSIADVLHVLVAAQEPPTVADLCWMLGGASTQAVELLLDSLRSLSLYQKQGLGDKVCVVPTHKSVRDFLCDKHRSGEHYVNLSVAHMRLVAACAAHLATMQDRAAEAIAETYAARYAAVHAKQAGGRGTAEPLEAAVGALRDALGQHLLTAKATWCVIDKRHRARCSTFDSLSDAPHPCPPLTLRFLFE